MLGDLDVQQRELAEYMSQLSELAYSASWMDGLEVALWEALEERRTVYGRLTFSAQQLGHLRELSARCGGWIVFDNEQEELFVPLAVWRTEAASSGTNHG